MTETTFADIVCNIDDLVTEEQWISFDVRPGRGEERWLNIILRKCDKPTIDNKYYDKSCADEFL